MIKMPQQTPNQPNNYVALDVGEARIGVARASDDMRIARPHGIILMSNTALTEIASLCREMNIETLVMGLPRGLDGQETAQTVYVRTFADRLRSELGCQVVFQDEAATSVEAEKLLEETNKPYTKADVDAQAAALILNDYLQAL